MRRLINYTLIAIAISAAIGFSNYIAGDEFKEWVMMVGAV